MKQEGSLPCSQMPTAGFYPIQSTFSFLASLKPIIILFSTQGIPTLNGLKNK
jgi:hypothetical protein